MLQLSAAQVKAPQFVFRLFAPTLEHLLGKREQTGKLLCVPDRVILMAVTSLGLNILVDSS